MAGKYSRRDFILTSSLAFLAAGISPVFYSCARKKNLELDEFIRLSSVLTGFKESELDSKLAIVYAISLQDYPPSKATLPQVYKDLKINADPGINPDPEIIEKTLFSNQDNKILSDTLINYWMSGVYKAKDGIKVSNYQEMYAFKATGYLIPNAQCRGKFGFWAEKPVVG
ncbi:MAG: sugar dehydrogenase complex small subunit [Ignavibacteria bacterium]